MFSLNRPSDSAIHRFLEIHRNSDFSYPDGEERFMVEWVRNSDEVRYDLFAFSRPKSWLARAGYPIARGLQRKFAAASQQAMVQAVSGVVTRK